MHLITNSYYGKLQDTSKVIFLGKWCITENNLTELNKIIYEIAPPFDQLKETSNYINEINKISNNLLLEITKHLNLIHNINYSQRSWNIILGHWVKRLVTLIYNRYHTINQTLILYNIKTTIGIKEENFVLVSDDTNDFLWQASNNNKWDILLNSYIIKFLNPNIKFIVNDFPENTVKEQTSNRIKKNSLKGRILENIFKKFTNNKDAFIYKTYLPLLYELRLQISLNQIPQFWQTNIEYHTSKKIIDTNLRNELNFHTQSDSDLEKFIFSIIHMLIPYCYLEGFPKLLNTVHKLSWPKDPKFIFTSVAFDFDEVFKVWTSNKIDNGTIYFVGQHGNNYGTIKNYMTYPEIETCDKFITWGWNNFNTKFISAFNFKIIGLRKFNKKQSRDGILLIELFPSHRIGPFDNHNAFDKYYKSQHLFIKNLDNIIQKDTTIRLHSASKYFNWNEKKFWNLNFPHISLDNGESPIHKIISKKKLVIHSYDSTGILETLSLNIPTICFWETGFINLENDVIPYYEILKNSKIYFDSPIDASNHINKIYGDINKWWYSESVQFARLTFIQKFSKIEKNPIRKLKKILN